MLGLRIKSGKVMQTPTSLCSQARSVVDHHVVGAAHAVFTA